MAPARVLVVDDAEEIQALVTGVLQAGGHDVQAVGDGTSALALAERWVPDVVVLDLTLPDLDGVEVCRRLRAFSQAYVLMLSARGDEIDRVVGLTVGADDYVTKPFSARELAARVDALLRRSRTAPAAPPTAEEPTGRRFGPVLVDPGAREISVDGVVVDATRMEFDILDALTEQPKRVLTRAQLRERVWGGGWFGDDHAVDVHVSNLRKKLSKAGAPEIITTVRGVGYRLSREALDA